MQDFRKLEVWQSGREFCRAIYDATRSFPADERFGFTSQMRRAARSICANIAEGCGYLGGNDSARFYQMSLGSANEGLSDMILTHDLGLLSPDNFNQLELILGPTRGRLIRLIEVTRRR